MGKSHRSSLHHALLWMAALLGAACLLMVAALLYAYTQSNPTQAPVVLAAAIQSQQPGLVTPSRTPFQPVHNSPTPTITTTPTASPSPTPTPSATPTATSSPTTTSSPTATPTITPSEAPTQPDLGAELPAEAYVWGITGYPQTLSLSCESRSAVDWAAYYGVSIGELEFQYALPASDNPNRGFVGNANGLRGQVPPASYGVHAAPVAALLRAYGLNASEQSGMRFDELRRSLTNGQPVIVWVVGNVWTGYGQSYTASDGETLTVAANEHTVIVTGYSPDTVTVVDGSLIYSPSIERFLASWSVLNYSSILYPVE